MPSAYTDYTQLLADPDIDAVSIVTMWDQHTEPALAALAAGKHVFLEKPMASTTEDCRAIVAAAKASDRALWSDTLPLQSPLRRGEAGNRRGEDGRIVSMYARRNIPAGVTTEILEKIGPITGDGVHDTDLMLWYSKNGRLGLRPVALMAKQNSPRPRWTMFRFAPGAIGVLENIWCLPDHTRSRSTNDWRSSGPRGPSRPGNHPNFSVVDADGWRSPDTTYWPTHFGRLAGHSSTNWPTSPPASRRAGNRA
ncbi:MAG: hypothetical protein Ct9H300mP1_05890 [Planctomycetaceae bacterium]|nr:MAG: hypothetical protein Ct9H300mP1_05890 [Planctomycetaceae bacterium]